jgi:hypothetical protein
MFKVFEEYLEDLQKKYEEAGRYRYCCECSDDGFGQQLRDAMDAETRLGNRIRFAKEVLAELKEYVINKKEEELKHESNV